MSKTKSVKTSCPDLICKSKKFDYRISMISIKGASGITIREKMYSCSLNCGQTLLVEEKFEKIKTRGWENNGK